MELVSPIPDRDLALLARRKAEGRRRNRVVRSEQTIERNVSADYRDNDERGRRRRSAGTEGLFVETRENVAAWLGTSRTVNEYIRHAI